MIGIVGWIGGGRIGIYRGTLVCWGPIVAGLLKHAPIMGGAAAITFGHTILARTREEVVRTHDHEMVHVRQYERWGVFFVPAYLGCSVWLWIRGRDPYLDNPFEIEAYDPTRTTF